MGKRDIITVSDLTDGEIHSLFAQADGYARALGERRNLSASRLAACNCLLMFYEPSTRTRVSFELAAKHFGMRVCVVTAKGSSVVKGESIEDTAQTFGAMGFDLAVVRHDEDDGVARFAREFPASVISGGSGKAAHPTQALLDAYALWKRGLLHPGLRIAIVGDLLHSRVARSNVRLLNRFGIVPLLVAPRELMPPEFRSDGEPLDAAGVKAVAHLALDPLLPQLDAIMMLRTQLERHGGHPLVDPETFTADYQLNARRLAA